MRKDLLLEGVEVEAGAVLSKEVVLSEVEFHLLLRVRDAPAKNLVIHESFLCDASRSHVVKGSVGFLGISVHAVEFFAQSVSD